MRFGGGSFHAVPDGRRVLLDDKPARTIDAMQASRLAQGRSITVGTRRGRFIGELMQIFRDIVYSISGTNVVDMLIIACLVYFILAWFRGTRSFQILATLVGIGVVYLAASWFGLIMTSVLFQYLWAAIILLLVIVFQPEIREMLDRASPVRYLGFRVYLQSRSFLCPGRGRKT